MRRGAVRAGSFAPCLGLWLALGLALNLACGTAAAARPAKPQPPGEPSMQVHLVRSAEPGCDPQCPEWIAAQGKIDGSSVARFKRVLRQLGDRKLPVLIDSNGGRVNEAFAIGRLARARGLDVVVSRTDFATCAPADAACRRRLRAETVRLGLPRADMSKCASSCAFVLAAGTRRLVGPMAYVGVHQIRSFYIYARVVRTYRFTATSKQLVSERRVTERVVETRTPQKTYDEIGRYFAEMGIGDGLMPLILATPGDRLHWLTPEELKATGLATDRLDGEQLLTRAAVALPQQTLVAPAAGDGGPTAVAADGLGEGPAAPGPPK
jgi:hypothetical protein